MTAVTYETVGYTGTVAGIRFEDGEPVGADDGPHFAANEIRGHAAVRYLRRRGFRLEDGRVVRDVVVAQPEPADPRRVGFLGSGIAPQGTRLRDAAVDPKPQDFLPPSNAGQANPHGPDVVSPGLHGVEGVRPVAAGLVPPPAPQEAKETAAAEQATSGETVDPTAIPQPKKGDLVGVWRDYAVHAHGVDRAEADELTKPQLIERFGGDG